MSRPRRLRSRVFVLSLALAAAASAVLVPDAPRPARAASDSLPGLIPKSPPFAAGFPIPFPRTTDFRGRNGAVLRADVDRDGRPELVLTVPSGLVTVLRADGSRQPGWPRDFAAWAQPAYPVGDPAIGDIDGDGRDEIVGCAVSGAAPMRTLLYAFHDDGADVAGWPVTLGWSGHALCSPARTLLVDLDGDGEREVVRAVERGDVWAYERDGRVVEGWPFRFGPDETGRLKSINADLVAADVDGDGQDDVIAVESGLSPRLTAIGRHGKAIEGFPVSLHELTELQAPATADLDGDGRQDIVQATLPFVPGFEGEPLPGDIVPAAVHAFDAHGGTLPGWPRLLAAGAPWGAVVADLDGDRSPDILQQDGDELLAFDRWGAMLKGYPQPIQRDFLRSQGVTLSPWIVADLDGDGGPDLLQARSNVYSGAAYLRIFGLRASGQPLRGFPFDAEGVLAASAPVVADLTGDGVGDLALLVSIGTTGGWSLVVWDLGALKATGN